MGLGASKKERNTKSCKCSTILENNHCCVHVCFGTNSDEKLKQLQTSLKPYKAAYIAECIMQYLPQQFDLIPVEIKCEPSYLALCHEESSRNYYEKGIPPCPIWRKSQEPTLKIVMMGGGGVGKSSLTIRYVTNTFLEEYDPTIQDNYIKSVTVNGEAVTYDILDTAGREEFCAMQDEWIRAGKMFCFLFACNSITSWDEAQIYRERVLRTKDENDNDWAMIVVMTKCDLLDTQQRVDRDGVMQVCNEWNVPYIETSAKEKHNIDFLFEQVLYEYWIQSQGVAKHDYESNTAMYATQSFYSSKIPKKVKNNNS